MKLPFDGMRLNMMSEMKYWKGRILDIVQAFHERLQPLTFPPRLSCSSLVSLLSLYGMWP